MLDKVELSGWPTELVDDFPDVARVLFEGCYFAADRRGDEIVVPADAVAWFRSTDPVFRALVAKSFVQRLGAPLGTPLIKAVSDWMDDRPSPALLTEDQRAAIEAQINATMARMERARAAGDDAAFVSASEALDIASGQLRADDAAFHDYNRNTEGLLCLMLFNAANDTFAACVAEHARSAERRMRWAFRGLGVALLATVLLPDGILPEWSRVCLPAIGLPFAAIGFLARSRHGG